MDLTKKLAEIPREKRVAFLKWKYRELQLMNQVDRLTDRYLTMGKLIRHCLEVIHRFFHFDLDWFKSVNDTYGHPFGNIVLQAVAGVLHNTIRNGVDMAARFGGEELALILPHTGEQGTFILAERIRAKVEALMLEHEGKPVKITISGGLATFSNNGETAEELLEAADTALYRSKEEGRNRMTVAETKVKG